MSDLPLTKVLDLADYAQLQRELAVVQRYFDPTTQHEHRRWEYAMALRALRTWAGAEHNSWTVADVGGAGSPFQRMAAAWGLGTDVAGCITLGCGFAEYVAKTVDVIDPKETVGVEIRAEEVAHHYDAVISISTLEHVPEPLGFLNACHHILKPGGLLFLTFDYAVDYTGRDDYHFHWMRERIVHEASLQALIAALTTLQGYGLCGGREETLTTQYIAPAVYDYTFASLCLQKP